MRFRREISWSRRPECQGGGCWGRNLLRRGMVGAKAEESLRLNDLREQDTHSWKGFQWSALVRSGKAQFAFFDACRFHVRVFKAVFYVKVLV